MRFFMAVRMLGMKFIAIVFDMGDSNVKALTLCSVTKGNQFS
jgi:hypothetical protein